MTYELAIDLTLGFALIALCWRVLTATDLFKAVVLFIVYGLLMSLAWARLHAIDIALAEAAIGAGLTGALMLDAVGQISGRSPRAEQTQQSMEMESEAERVES